MPTEHDHSENLRASREKSGMGAIKKIKKMGQRISLLRYSQIEDFIFVGMALILAFLKDLLDYVGIGSLPGIGTVLTIIVSIAIAACIFVAGANKKMRAKAKATAGRYLNRKIGTLTAGTLIEILFGINFLPIETLMVLYLYRLILLERREEAEAARETEQESYAFA